MPETPANTSDYRIVRTILPDGAEEFTIKDFYNTRGAADEPPAYPIGMSRLEMWHDFQAMMLAFTKPVETVDMREPEPAASL